MVKSIRNNRSKVGICFQHFLSCVFIGYSKSAILDLAELIAETAAKYFPEFDDKQQSNGQTNEMILPDECGSYMTTTAPTTTSMPVNRKYTQHLPGKIVFNDGTAAGVLNNLKGCTRTMHLHEADVTLKSLGLMLPSPADLTPSRVDPFRSTLMTLHEKPGSFLRVLKKETINVSGSKLNIFVCSLNCFLKYISLRMFLF